MLGRYVFRKKIISFLASMLDMCGYAVTGIFFKKKDLNLVSAKNILIVRLDHLGDVLAASALPKILKNKFADARISFLTSSLGADILQSNPFVHEVLIYDAPHFIRKGGAGGPCKSFWSLLRETRVRSFDLALAPRGDLRENFLLWKAGIPHRAGYGVSGGGFFLNGELPYRFGAHESEHTLDLLRSLEIKDSKLEPEIYFSSDEKKIFADKLSEWGMDEGAAWAGIQVDAGTPAKDWPEKELQNFFKRFAAEYPRIKMVLVGSDLERAARLSKFLENEKIGRFFLNLVGRTSVRELFFVLKNLKAFIGPDSGPAHVAASIKIPTLFLYSGTNVFEEWKSLSPTATFLRHEVPCAPCHRTACNVPGHPCMEGIEAKAVLGWIETLQII